MIKVNEVMIAGNLTRNPELKKIGDKDLCKLSIAVSRGYGEKERVAYVDVDVWGKQGATCAKILKKGDPAHISGSLAMDQWEDRGTGKKRSKIYVVARKVQFILQKHWENNIANWPEDHWMEL